MSDSALKMDALHSSKLLTFSYIITQSHKPEDDSMNLHIQNTSFLTATYLRVCDKTCFSWYAVRILRYQLVLLRLTLRSLTLYIYGAPILDVSRSHTTTQHSR